MGFKKHNWTKYGNIGMRCEIKVLDENNRTLDTMKWAASDKNSERRIFTILKNGYGIFKKPTVPVKKSTDALSTKKLT